MLILGIDTSSKISSIALYDTEKGLIASESVEVKLTHSDTLMGYIENILVKTGVDIKIIDRIAVGVGPGSFTGVRIGVGTAKGLCYGLKNEICGVSSLKAVAAKVAEGNFNDMLVVPMFDAKKERVFAAVYKIKNGKLIVVRESFDSNIDLVISEYKSENTIFCGNAVSVYNEKINSFDLIVSKNSYNIDAEYICKLGVAKSQAERAKENCHGV